jgi:hypothetical protein
MDKSERYLVELRRPGARVPMMRRLATAVVVAISVAVLAGAAPSSIRIDRVAPDVAERGAQVVLRGGGFGAKNVRVWVGGVPAQVLSATGNRVLFRVPDAAPLGPTTVEAANPGGERTSAPFVVSWDGRATPLLASAQAVQAEIGRDGGTIESEGIELEIPAGALSAPELITLTPLAGLQGSPLDGSLIGGAKLEPEGLHFLTPATLSMALPAGMGASDVLGFGSAGDGSDLHLRPRSIAGGTITLEVWHFSTAGASGGGSAAAAAMQSRQPSAAEQQALQRIAVAQQACDAEVAQGIVGGPACADVRPESVRALFDWYTNRVRPGLEQAATALSFEAEAAMAEWLAWQAEVVLVFLNDPPPQCGTLQNECDQAHVLATTAVGAHAQRRLGNCTGTSLAAQMRDVARMADFADAGAIDLTSVGLPDAANGELLRACAHLEIDVIDFPVVASLLIPNTLRGRVTVDVFTGPDRTDVPFALFVDGALVGAASDGSFQTTLTPIASPLDAELEAEATDLSLQNTAFTAIEQLTRPARDRLELVAQGPTSIPAGGMVPLLVRVAGDGMTGNVPLTVGGVGSVSPSVAVTDSGGVATAVYTAPSSAANPNAQVIATLPDGTTASVPITITDTVTVSLDPTTATLNAGGAQTFTSTVTGSFLGVTWSATGGSIVSTGGNTARYEAGSTPGTYAVTATSIEDPAVSATASVTIQPATAGQIVVISRQSSIDAVCVSDYIYPCPGESDFSTALGPFSATATSVLVAPSNPDFPGFIHEASATVSQSSDAQLNVLFPLNVNFSGSATATAFSNPGGDPELGGVLRGGLAAASGRTGSDTVFEVSGAGIAFTLFGGATVSGDGCVDIVLKSLSDGGVEFEADFCAGDPPEGLAASGFLAPGRYAFNVRLSASAAWDSDITDGVLSSGGTSPSSATIDVSLVLE